MQVLKHENIPMVNIQHVFHHLTLQNLYNFFATEHNCMELSQIALHTARNLFPATDNAELSNKVVSHMSHQKVFTETFYSSDGSQVGVRI
jgi:hypothetical protein